MPHVPTLITIPLSHYCERARWALDWARLPFREEPHLQLFHRRPVKRAGGARTTPVLILEDATLTDSAHIVTYADERTPPSRSLYPADGDAADEVKSLELELAASFGVESRRLAYHRLLPHRALLLRYNNRGAPFHESLVLRLSYRRAEAVLRRYLKIDEERARRAEEEVQRSFDAIAARLADGRPYLGGDRFTAADLTFAALAGPLVFPEGYGWGVPQLSELPDALRRATEAHRAHPAGAHALRMYREHRSPS